MTTDAQKLEKRRQWISKSERSLDRSRNALVESGDYDFAASHAYYSAFYALTALLLTTDSSPTTHSGVLSEFNRLFIRENVFPKEFSKLTSRLFQQRLTADYEAGMSISKVEAEGDFSAAKRVVEEIKDHLTENGLL